MNPKGLLCRVRLVGEEMARNATSATPTIKPLWIALCRYG
jgi:hypothetical protein